MKKYSGNRKAFVMAVYDAKNEEEALKAIEDLSAKVNVYYTSELGNRDRKIMRKAAAIVCFLSEDTMPAMQEVIAYAATLNKEIVPVYFDRFTLEPGMRMILGTKQGVSKYKYEDETEYRRELAEAPLFGELKITPEQKKSFKLAVALSAIAAVAVVAVALTIAYINYYSANKIDETSLLGQLGLSGNAKSIRKVYVYGKELRDTFEEDGVHLISYAGSYDKFQVILPSINGTVEVGTITDVSDFTQLENLEELSIAGNPLSDLAPLWELKKLRKLDISANQAELKLDGISKLSNLQFLNIAYCNVTSGFEELKTVSSLKTLCVSHEMGEQLAALGEVSFDIVYVDVAVRTYEELKAASENEHVYFIFVQNPDYRPDAEYDDVKDLVIEIPEGETITIRRNVQVGGVRIHLINRGTMIVSGEIEMGLTTIENRGTIDVCEGGLYLCGMAGTENYGTMIIEKGARQQVERGNEIWLKEGSTYTLNGTLGLYIGGAFYIDGGEMVNNGEIEVAHADNFQWYPDDSRNEFASLPGSGTVKIVEVEFEMDPEAE